MMPARNVTDDQVRYIRTVKDKKNYEIAEELGISRSQVSKIKAGKKYRHVPE